MELIKSKAETDWFVVYTYSQYEKKILKEFERNHIESFLPLQKVVRQWSDRKKKVEVPLFPNYIFVRTTIQNMWQVLKVSGVIKFITHDGKPIPVLNEKINAIRKLDNQEVEVTNELFAEGDEVKVVGGPMSGSRGVLVEKKGKSRLAIQVEIMKQSVLVDISPNYLEKLEGLEKVA